MSSLPPLPPLPARIEPDRLAELDDPKLDEALAEIAAAERATQAAMAPHQAQLRELRARSGEISTERRRRDRARQIATRAQVRERARSGEMPSLAEALAIDGMVPDTTPLADVPLFLRTGGQVRLGYATRPGPISLTDGRQNRSATTWGQVRDLYAAGWEVGSAGVPGVRVHVPGSRVERVVEATDVVLGSD